MIKFITSAILVFIITSSPVSATPERYPTNSEIKTLQQQLRQQSIKMKSSEPGRSYIRDRRTSSESQSRNSLFYMLTPVILEARVNASTPTRSESRISVPNIANSRNVNILRMKRSETYHCQYETSDKIVNSNTTKFKCDIVRIGKPSYDPANQKDLPLSKRKITTLECRNGQMTFEKEYDEGFLARILVQCLKKTQQ